MSLPNESSIRLGLPAQPLSLDPKLNAELRPIYNAMKILARAIDTYTGAVAPEDGIQAEVGPYNIRINGMVKVYMVAFEPIPIGGFVAFYSDAGDSKARLALSPTYKCRGFASTAATLAGDIVEVTLLGTYFQAPAGTFVPNATYYLSSTSAGALDAAPGDQSVGFAIDDTTFFVCPVDVSSTVYDAAGTAGAAQDYAVQRDNHTGTQLAATISDFDSAVLAALPTSGYSLNVLSLNVASPADGTTVYFGGMAVAPAATSGIARLYIPLPGVIKKVYLFGYAGGTGTNEAINLFLRLNNTTDYAIGTASANVAAMPVSTTALNGGNGVTVAAGDYIEIKVVYPTWATNPTAVRWSGVVFVE